MLMHFPEFYSGTYLHFQVIKYFLQYAYHKALPELTGVWPVTPVTAVEGVGAVVTDEDVEPVSWLTGVGVVVVPVFTGAVDVISVLDCMGVVPLVCPLVSWLADVVPVWKNELTT